MFQRWETPHTVTFVVRLAAIIGLWRTLACSFLVSQALWGKNLWQLASLNLISSVWPPNATHVHETKSAEEIAQFRFRFRWRILILPDFIVLLKMAFSNFLYDKRACVRCVRACGIVFVGGCCGSQTENSPGCHRPPFRRTTFGCAAKKTTRYTDKQSLT